MTDLALILGVAAAGYGLALLLRIPVLPLLILFGFGLSLSPLSPQQIPARALVEFGLAFLVFGAGIELTPRRFAHQTSAVLWVALVQFVVVGVIGIGAALLLGHGELAAVYIGFAISASSTLVVIRHLRAQQQMFTPFGRLVTGVLLVQDIALIALLTVLAAPPGGWIEAAQSLGGLLVLGAAAVCAHVWVLPALTKTLQGDEETLLLVALATLFLFVAGAYLLALPFIAGAFLAGFALASFPGNALLRGLVGSVLDFFQAVFFTALGALLTISSPEVVVHALVLAAMVFLVTPPVVALMAEWRGLNARSGVESGLLLAQTSELSIIFALVGVSLGHIDQNVFTTLALVAAITMTLTPFLATDTVTWKLLHLHPARHRKPPPVQLDGHVVVLGFGSAGMWLVKPLLDAGYRVVVVDDAPAVIDELARRDVITFRGDGSDKRTLEAVRAADAKMVIASLPRVGDLLKVIAYLPGVEVVARVFEESEARAGERAGGTAILNSEAARDEFLKWFGNFSK